MASRKKTKLPAAKIARIARDDEKEAGYSKTEKSAGFLIRKAYRAFTRSLEQRLAPHDISLSMWFFLRLLWEQEGLTQRELSDELGLTQATTVTAMHVMERRGIIERRLNSVDRRKVNIFLTAKGHALKSTLLRYANEVNGAACRDIESDELEQLRGTLKRIIVSLDDDQARFQTQVRNRRSAATQRTRTTRRG